MAYRYIRELLFVVVAFLGGIVLAAVIDITPAQRDAIAISFGLFVGILFIGWLGLEFKLRDLTNQIDRYLND